MTKQEAIDYWTKRIAKIKTMPYYFVFDREEEREHDIDIMERCIGRIT